MVKICSQNYNSESEEKYKPHFEKYSFPLSSFQKYSIEAIVEGHHVLVCVPTGSGKTLSGEFAIEYFVSKGKKVIYTSPIKALSNQKFFDFTKKFPHISFGILTGDIKFNPEADVLIMTAEILQNTLYKKKSTNYSTPSNVSFDMDFENELACIVMDEVHYINDADRGKVWEETILMLPSHIQMVMLSATLNSPEKFASWCETRGSTDMTDTNNKIVYLAPAHERIVPLTHYSFITCNSGFFKILKDKALEQEIMKTINTMHTIQFANGKFHDDNFKKIQKTLDIFESKKQFVKRAHVLNQVSKYMVDNTMLPAICFVFSRKMLEVCATEITTNLLEFDSKVPYIVKNECEQIIRKLPNYQEYLQLPEYQHLVKLLEKGIAIHHAGIMPVLREMVELLFAKGYIKLLFATETFAVGINMPTKSVIFTDVHKFDGNGNRILLSHEYTQMAGRAGRRGIDTVGHVIHLNNLFHNVEPLCYKTMMKGDPQKLISKFKISYNLLLNLIYIDNQNFVQFVSQSMMQDNIDNELSRLYYILNELTKEMNKYEEIVCYLKIPQAIIEDYISLSMQREKSINSKRKEVDKKMNNIKNTYANIEHEKDIMSKYNNKKKEIQCAQDEIKKVEQTIQKNIDIVLQIMQNNNCIEIKTEKQETEKQETDNENIKKYQLTEKGFMASQVREVHCLIFAELIMNKQLFKFSANELVGIFSCFTNITVPEKCKQFFPTSENQMVQQQITDIYEMHKQLEDTEINSNIHTGTNSYMQYNIIDYTLQWCECENAEECKQLIYMMEMEKQIFLGEFIKALLKINNIASELEKVAEYIGNIQFLHTLKEIPGKILKYVATNQSLYV